MFGKHLLGSLAGESGRCRVAMLSQADISRMDSCHDRRPAATVCPRVQPGQLPPSAGPAAVGAKVVTHSRYVVFQMAEVAVPKRLFRAILARIQRLRMPEAVPG